MSTGRLRRKKGVPIRTLVPHDAQPIRLTGKGFRKTLPTAVKPVSAERLGPIERGSGETQPAPGTAPDAARKAPNNAMNRAILVSALPGGKKVFASRRYTLLQSIGKGGMGSVFKARDTLLDTVVALKFLPATALSGTRAETFFRNEAAVAMRLSHEHIVRLYNLEKESGRLFLVMEYVDGPDLSALLGKRGRLPLEDVLVLSEACARALDYAHDRGVLHLDLKPANLMLTRSGVPKIVDLGTARRTHASGRARDTGYIEGTPAYMSPEQIRGEATDRRSDVFSLALTFYECLTGRAARPRNAGMEDAAARAIPPPAGVSPAVAAALAGALEANPAGRWPTVGTFHARLAEAAGT